MRSTTWVPAERLGSVALRYRGVLRPGYTRFPPWRRVQVGGTPSGRVGTQQDQEALAARRQRVEAILLIAREPLSSRRLAEYAHLADGTEARTLVRRLNQLYDETGRAFRVEQVGGGYRLLTRAAFAPWLRRLAHVPPQERLSAPALETLAVVAYRQPVLRADIEAIRGVNCGEILRQLMERDLVRIGGRSDELGRPYLYTTTKRFLQLFGLQSLEELPRAFTLRNDDRSTDHTDGVVTAPMSTDVQQLEQEKSEVILTLPIRRPVPGPFPEVTSQLAFAPRCGYDDDEYDDEDFDDDDDDDEEEEEDDDDLEEDDLDDDDLEDEEWEEVEDDDEDLDEGWDEDEEWDEEDEEFEDDDDVESDDDEYDDDEEDEDDEEWE